MKKLLLIMVISLTVGAANAGDNNWTPTSLDPNEVLEIGNWAEPNNWSLGSIPTSSQKLSFTICTVPSLIDSDTYAVCGQLVMGDNGPSDCLHHLIIEGTLHTHGDAWTAVGYNRWSRMDVERGGTVITEHRLGVGLVGSGSDDPANKPSVLNVNGGSVDVDGNLQIGTDETTPGVGYHIGIVNVSSGTLEAADLEFRDESGTYSFMDICHGTVVIDGDVTALVTTLVASGAITACGEPGNDGTGAEIAYSYANGVTTITAYGEPHAYSPAMDEVVPVGNVILSWNNLEPSPVWIDVWFGTDKDSMTKIENGVQDLTSTSAFAPVFDEYVWRVDVNLDNPATEPDPNVIEGTEMYFVASDCDPPGVIMDTPNTTTWKNEPVQLDITVSSCDEIPTLTFFWESSDPNAVFLPSNDVKDPQVVMDYASGWYTATVTVSDSNPFGATDEASVDIYCADNRCGAVTELLDIMPPDFRDYPADINNDCMHDLLDFALIAADWLLDYAITEPTPIP